MNKTLLRAFLAAVFLFIGFLPAEGQMKCDRGYAMVNQPVKIVKKGDWMFGGSFGFSGATADNNSILVISGINARLYDVDVSPNFCYMFGDNMGVGGRFSYKRNFINVASAGLSMEGVDVHVKDYYLASHSYLFGAYFRYYKPFGRTGRFSAFVDAELSAGGRQHKMVDGHSEDVKASYGVGFQAALGAYTGVIAFLTSHFAFDVRVGLFSLNYMSENQTHNQIGQGNDKFGSANFMIDLLALQFGIYYYL
ncbi:MAG: hypothetical protein J6Y32_07175 [Bacteroidales bacterium]|nr:hypothetical protein [Bacteroidales bacterium]